MEMKEEKNVVMLEADLLAMVETSLIMKTGWWSPCYIRNEDMPNFMSPLPSPLVTANVWPSSFPHRVMRGIASRSPVDNMDPLSNALPL